MRTDESRDVMGFSAANDNQLNRLVVCLEVMRGVWPRVDGEDGYIGIALHPTAKPAVEAIVRHFAWVPTRHTEREKRRSARSGVLESLSDDEVAAGLVGHHDSNPAPSIQWIITATDNGEGTVCVSCQRGGG
jgi:hypothetical protein